MKPLCTAMGTNDRRGGAPPGTRDAATSTEPVLAERDAEAFIGHDAPTQVNIDVSRLRAAHLRGTTTARGLPPVQLEPSPTPTPPPELDDTRVRPAALEALAGVALPARFRGFLERSALRFEGHFHDGLQPPSRPGLRILTGELTPFWVMTAAERKGAHARPYVPFAACGAGDDTTYVVVDVSVAALPVYRFRDGEGFVRIEGSLEDFVANLSEATAGRARSARLVVEEPGTAEASIPTPVPGSLDIAGEVHPPRVEEDPVLPAPTPPRPGPSSERAPPSPELPDEVPAGEEDAMLPDEVPPVPMPSPRRR